LQEELTAALAEKGYRVRNAYDGEAGLRLVRAINRDLVVLDLILPKIDGFKVLQALEFGELRQYRACDPPGSALVLGKGELYGCRDRGEDHEYARFSHSVVKWIGIQKSRMIAR
jgi:hypothetical protein